MLIYHPMCGRRHSPHCNLMQRPHALYSAMPAIGHCDMCIVIGPVCVSVTRGNLFLDVVHFSLIYF